VEGNPQVEEVGRDQLQDEIKSIESVGGMVDLKHHVLGCALESSASGRRSIRCTSTTSAARCKIFHKDIVADKASKNRAPGSQASRDASKLKSLMRPSVPRLLQLAAVVHKLGAKEATDANIIAAAIKT